LQILRDLGNRPDQGFVLTYLGYALEGLGHLAEASEIYEQALALQRDLGQCQLALETQAGLARVSLAQGNLSQALDRAEEILKEMQINSHENTNLRIYLTCYCVLRANHDPRAQVILSTAHSSLQERAAKIKDKNLRRSFLEHVREHREIRRELRHLQRQAQASH
jgi:tetratricopeptide (TPR) repeat protein